MNGKEGSGVEERKIRTGIEGLDDILRGGLPKGRSTLITGEAGSGKTALAMEILHNGVAERQAPGVFVSFEESPEDLIRNYESFGKALQKYVDQGTLLVENAAVDSREFLESGEYDLDGLFIRLDQAIKAVSAKRLALDAIDALFAGFENSGIVRAELRRLLEWLKARGLTVLVTGDETHSLISRQSDLAKYVVDCVIELSQELQDQIATRRLRIAKYRGSAHGADKHPFMIDETGLSLLPITSAGLSHSVTEEKISSGIDRFDTMLGGDGFYRGSSILVSGSAGTGKSSVAATFASSACSGGERTLYFAFEESSDQIQRNMKSIGIDLGKHIKEDKLQIIAMRPSHLGLESHLSHILKNVDEYRASIVCFDPMSSLVSAGDYGHAKSAGTRLVDQLKQRGVTALFTDLIHPSDESRESEIGISSVMDCWIVLSTVDSGGERNRGVYVIKARGLGHSNQFRELKITSQGLRITDVFMGDGEFAMGSKRLEREAMDRVKNELRDLELEREEKALALRKRLIEARIQALEAEFELDRLNFEKIKNERRLNKDMEDDEKARKAEYRKADHNGE